MKHLMTKIFSTDLIMGLSTFSACADILDHSMMNHDKGYYTGILLVDQKSAYGVMSHDILLEK